MAAPIGAIVTFIALGASGELSARALALLLVFSGGTFLYVSAVHILPEFSAATMKQSEAAVLVAGILLPITPQLLDLGHGH
jgi:zinc transporter ZupT